MLTIGLVNTYDKIKVLDAHYRAIARSAPICYAYGYNLALFDFPFDLNVDELTKIITEKTTIGDSGKYLDILNREKRVSNLPLPKKGFQSHLGAPVVTTSKPDKKFQINSCQLVEEIMNNKSFLILIGLGRKGLPKSILRFSKYHLDITGNGVSLETCTAIGAIPSTIHSIMNTKYDCNNLF